MESELESAGQCAQMPESRGAFGGFIGPMNLLALVQNAVPWLFETSPRESDGEAFNTNPLGPLAWRELLLHAPRRFGASETPTDAEWVDYFALCLAAHFATVGSFVPTDVDTKIRHHLWFRVIDPAQRERMRITALGLAAWDISSVSRRIITVPDGAPVSGHDGERLSVLVGGLLAHLRSEDSTGAQELEEAIDSELRREAATFERVRGERGRELDLLRLAATMTHNAGDVDQGLAAPKGKSVKATPHERYGRLAHERPERYGGSFARAAKLYRELMAAEGHRHYPLRDVRALRASPDLLLPIGPFFDAWGYDMARSPLLQPEDRAAVVAALVTGIRRVRGQEGYFRALAGFERGHKNGLACSDLTSAVPAAVRRGLRDKDLRRRTAITQQAFESRFSKEARRLLPS